MGVSRAFSLRPWPRVCRWCRQMKEEPLEGAPRAGRAWCMAPASRAPLTSCRFCTKTPRLSPAFPPSCRGCCASGAGVCAVAAAGLIQLPVDPQALGRKVVVSQSLPASPAQLGSNLLAPGSQ